MAKRMMDIKTLLTSIANELINTNIFYVSFKCAPVSDGFIMSLLDKTNFNFIETLIPVGDLHLARKKTLIKALLKKKLERMVEQLNKYSKLKNTK